MKLNYETDIYLQSEEQVKEFEKLYGVRNKSSGEQIDDMLDKIVDMVIETAETGGNYTNDSIRIKIELEYLPEDK